MSTSVPRIGRVLDFVGLTLFLVGAGVYGWAWLGMRDLESSQPASADGRQFAAVGHFMDLHELSRVGLAVMAAGVVTAVAAMVAARVVAGRNPES